jgi:DNA invertase Pin-like site-specific DNA recombinase
MARIGYLRARRKQEIEEFKNNAQVDKTFIDLTNEFGSTHSELLKSMLDQLEVQDTLVIRSLTDVANDVVELRSFLETLKKVNAELVILDSNESGILTDQGQKVLSVIEGFMNEKLEIEKLKQLKAGRPTEPYPSNFLGVYEEYRNVDKEKRISGQKAAEKLSISYNKFRELVNIFELKV